MRAPAIALAAMLAMLAGSDAAPATEFCAVADSPDGFVALRAGPGTQFPVVARMKPEDEVRLLAQAKGSWLPVHHWRGSDRLQETTRSRYRKGWVHKRYVGECG